MQRGQPEQSLAQDFAGVFEDQQGNQWSWSSENQGWGVGDDSIEVKKEAVAQDLIGHYKNFQ